MQKVQVNLQDYAGRQFGGEFEAVKVSMTKGKFVIDLQYCGVKSSKKLSYAALTIDPSIIEQLCEPKP